MLKGAQPLPHRVQWPHRWVVWLVAGLVVATGIAVAVDRAFFSAQETRPEFMQSVLDGLVKGPNRLAPGATAYVSGPHGIWVGSAGVAEGRGAHVSRCADADREQQQDMARRGRPPTRPRGEAEPRRHGRPVAAWSASGTRERDHASRADVGLERSDRRQRRLRVAECRQRLSRACRRLETEGTTAHGCRADPGESGG